MCGGLSHKFSEEKSTCATGVEYNCIEEPKVDLRPRTRLSNKRLYGYGLYNTGAKVSGFVRRFQVKECIQQMVSSKFISCIKTWVTKTPTQSDNVVL